MLFCKGWADTQIYSIADVLAEPLKFKVETRYLYVSRKALFLPSLIDEGDIDEMLELLESTNLSHGLRELGFSEEEILAFNPNRLKKQILELSEQKRAILLEYLKQEGFDRSLRIGVVDVGWKARLQLCLSKILDYGGLYNPNWGITGFYVGLDLAKAAPVYKFDKRLCFFSNSYSRILHHAYACLYETFTAATHGLTVGYEKGENGKIKPVLKEEENTELLKWGLRTQHDSIKHFTKLFVKNVFEI